MDEEEEEEILDNVRSLVASFGNIDQLTAIPNHRSSSDYAVKVVFGDHRSAQAAASSLNGMILGGKPLAVDFLEEDARDKIPFDATRDQECDSPSMLKADGDQSAAHKLDLSASMLSHKPILQLFNFATLLERKDDQASALDRLKNLCRNFGEINSIACHHAEGDGHSSAKIVNQQLQRPNALYFSQPLVEVEVASLVDAAVIADHLKGLVVAGKAIDLHIVASPTEHRHHHHHILTDTNCELWWRNFNLDARMDVLGMHHSFGLLLPEELTMLPNFAAETILSVEGVSLSHDQHTDECYKIVSYKSLSACLLALNSISERRTCKLVQMKSSDYESNNHRCSSSDIVILESSQRSKAALLLDGFLSDEDVESMLAEELVQVKIDVASLCSRGDADIPINYVGIWDTSEAQSSYIDMIHELIGCVQFVDDANAMEAMCHLDGYPCATEGVKLRARLVYKAVDDLAQHSPSIAKLSSHSYGETSISLQQDWKYVDAREKPHLPKHELPSNPTIPVRTTQPSTINACC
jgi:hypothetical protein